VLINRPSRLGDGLFVSVRVVASACGLRRLFDAYLVVRNGVKPLRRIRAPG
jgi:hypothetical protein